MTNEKRPVEPGEREFEDYFGESTSTGEPLKKTIHDEDTYRDRVKISSEDEKIVLTEAEINAMTADERFFRGVATEEELKKIFPS